MFASSTLRPSVSLMVDLYGEKRNWMNQLLQKYRIIGKKGEGTFSEVLKCQSLKDGTFWACKKMKQLYDSSDQVNNLREIQAMRRLSPHPNVLELQEILFDKKSGSLVLICELMDMNIYELIRGRRHYLPEHIIKNYMYQLCRSISHMHRHGIFHRDVKPENILIKENQLKLADFGSCRSMHSKQPYTEYISTRWYRAPECLLTDGYYSYKMDIWSLGCVFFEILSLRPLFPGANEVDQIAKIHDIMGTPHSSILNKLQRNPDNSATEKIRKARGVSFHFPAKRGIGIERMIPHASQEAVDLIYCLCTYDPEERMTAHQALRHTYFQEYRGNEQLKTREVEGRVEESSKNVQPKDVLVEMKTPEIEKENRSKLSVITNLPKAQLFSNSVIHQKDTRRRKNKKVRESHQYTKHTGLLPKVAMQSTNLNSSFSKQPCPGMFSKFQSSSSTTVLPNIHPTYQPRKASNQTMRSLYRRCYPLPFLDRGRQGF